MRISGRERAALILGIAVAAVILIYSLAVVPMVEGQRRVRERLEAKTLLLGKYHRALSQRNALLEERERLRERLKGLESRLLGGDKPPLAAAELQKLLKSAAEKAKVNIISERILEPSVKGHYREIPVEVNVKCSITKFTQLLFAIENSPRHLSIKKMKIRADHKINPKEISATLVVIGLIRNRDAI